MCGRGFSGKGRLRDRRQGVKQLASGVRGQDVRRTGGFLMKMYSSDICKDCRAFKALIAERGIESAFEIVDITENTQNLREFLKLRDTEAVFEAVRERGAIGIPCFVGKAGAITLNENAALSWVGQAQPEREYPECISCK